MKPLFKSIQFYVQIKKVKAIYHSMNMFNLDYTQRCLVGECWCPVDSLDDIQAALTRGKVHMSYHTSLDYDLYVCY